jgi:hypothetical protein
MSADLGHGCPQLLARCRYVPYTLGEFAEKVRAFLRDVLPLHPLFSELHLIGRSAKDSPPLTSDLSNVQAWILERGWDPLASSHAAYSDLDATGRPTLDSRGRLGFMFLVGNLKGWDTKIRIDISTGIPSNVGICNFIFPRKNHAEFRELPLMRDLLGVVVKHWPVDYASVAFGGWNRAINWNDEDDVLGDRRIDRIEIGWLTYMKDSSIVQALPA